MKRTEASKRRILVINPNSSLAVTEAIDLAVRPLRIAGGPQIEVDRLREGPKGIATQFDADSVIAALVEWVRGDRADAFVIACFSDPGLHAMREVANSRPVMGIAEWALLRALTLGEKFGIIALSKASAQRQQRYVRQLGLQHRYVGSWPIDASADDTTDEGILDRLAEAGRRLVTQYGADVVILGCAGMTGNRRVLEEIIDRPVIEPTQQAVVAAVGAVLLMES